MKTSVNNCSPDSVVDTAIRVKETHGMDMIGKNPHRLNLSPGCIKGTDLFGRYFGLDGGASHNGFQSKYYRPIFGVL